MFSATNYTKENPDFPEQCSFRKSDWDILAAMWHAIAFVDEVKEKPTHVTLLDVPLVIFRTSSGITVANDVCPHRGAALSMGCVENDRIICPFHGLEFDAEGTCTKIPAREDQSAPIASSFNIRTYQTQERYGLLWVCLSESPILPLPEWHPLEDEALMSRSGTTVLRNFETWEVSAPRHTENFNDPAHLSFVHKNSFGNPDNATIPQYDVDQSIPHVLKREKLVKQAVHDNPREYTLLSELTLPFSSMLIDSEADGTIVNAVFDVASPISAYQSAIFQISVSETNDPRTDIAYIQQVNEEDKAVLAGVKPQNYPLNIKNERHIHADACAVAYRRSLAKLGLGAPE